MHGGVALTSAPRSRAHVLRGDLRSRPGQSPTPLLNRILVRGVLSPGRQKWQAQASSSAHVRPERKFRELQFDLRRSNDYPLKERTQELFQHRAEVVFNGWSVQAQYGQRPMSRQHILASRNSLIVFRLASSERCMSKPAARRHG